MMVALRTSVAAFSQCGQGVLAVHTDFEADGCPLTTFRKLREEDGGEQIKHIDAKTSKDSKNELPGGPLKIGKFCSMSTTDRSRFEKCLEQFDRLRYMRALQGYSGGVLIDPKLKNNVAILYGTSLDCARVGCLTKSAPQIPALVMTMVSFKIHVTMLATDDGWGGHISIKWRAPSDNILDNSGRLLTPPCANASWKSACRSSNQFVTSFGTWQGINGIPMRVSTRRCLP